MVSFYKAVRRHLLGWQRPITEADVIRTVCQECIKRRWTYIPDFLVITEYLCTYEIQVGNGFISPGHHFSISAKDGSILKAY